jgi:hypothetical protein
MDRDNALLNRLHQLQTDIREFKSPQPIGSDSVQVYTTMTNDQWDVIWTSTAEFDSVFFNRWWVYFLADTQTAPFGRIRVIADIDGIKFDPSTPESARLSNTRPYVQGYDDIFGTGINSPQELNNPSLLRFVVDASTPSAGQVLRMKFFVDATDTGTISWKQQRTP